MPDTMIEIDGIKLLYRRVHYTYGPYGIGSGYYTEFFEYEPEIEHCYQYFFFGKQVERKYYKFLFKLKMDIESGKNSKDKIRSKILKKYNKVVRNKNRREEIEKGDIV